jgi:hypothetical protein
MVAGRHVSICSSVMDSVASEYCSFRVNQPYSHEREVSKSK